MEERTHPPMIAPHMIGRTSQLAALHRLVEQTKRGEGHLALINGEAGVGKSRLITEIKSLAISQGFLLLQGNCFPIDLTCPYAPLLDLLRALFASQLAIPFAIELDKLAHDLFPLLPELVPEQVASQLPLEPEQEKRRLFAVLANFFTRLSASSPLLLVIEDVHWSDSTSLDFLHTLARRAISHPLLLLVTYRQDEMRAELSNWLTQLNRERLAETIPLLPLSRNDVDLMLSSLFDQKHTAFDMRRFLHGELLELLYTLTEGNPFFVEETLSAMIAADDIFYTQGYWNRKSKLAARIPQSAQDAVLQRTQHLGEAARQVLTLAAVAGRHFDFALLQQLTGYDEDHLLLIMKELVSARLVVEVSGEQFAFRHPLTRRAIYTQLLTRERTQVHARIGETMEQHQTFPDTHVEDLATHFYQGRQWQKAMDYAQRAGEKALQLYSHRAAIEYFTWALEAASHLSSPSAMFYRARGHAYETLGEFEQAHYDYTQASNAARTLNDRITEWQSAIDLGFLWVGRDYAQAEPWFRLSLTLAQSLDDPALHAHSLNRIGNWHINVEQPQEALRYHREALAIFEGLHDTRGIAETLDLLGMASYLSGDLIGGTAYYRQAITLFTNLGDKSGLTSSLATLSLRGPTFQTDSLVADASLAEAYLDVERALRIAREIGHRSDEAYALFQIGLCLGSQGEYGRSFEEAKLSLEIAEEIEHRQWQTAAHSILGGIYTWLFAYPQANEQFEQTLALAHESGSLVWTRIATGYLASLAILRHDPAQAERLLYGTLNADSPAETMAQRMLWCASVELELAQGRPARALAIIDRLIASGQRTEGRTSLRVLKLRGEALTGLQRLDEAEIAYEEARDIASMHGVRPMYWRICVALGRLHQKQGKNSEAEQAFGTARTLIEELAATIADESLRENFLQQATTMLPHTRPLSSKEVAKQAYGGLTTREREIAALIAQEKYNREIAELLVLSERTVETHVSNIMFKLGFTSRRQIAMWANERGLTADR